MTETAVETPTEANGASYEDYASNINIALMLGTESASLHELVDKPIHVLQGMPISQEDAWNALDVKTVKDLAEYKFAQWAYAVVTLAQYEISGKRKEGSLMNMEQVVTLEHQKKGFKEISTSPVSVLQGIGEEATKLLEKVDVKTVEDLANWHYIKIAKAIVDLMEVEKVKAAK